MGAGVVSLLSSLGVKFLAPSVSDVRLLLASLVIGALGNAVMIDFPGESTGKLHVLFDECRASDSRSLVSLGDWGIGNTHWRTRSFGRFCAGYAKGHASAPPVEGFILGFVMLNIAFPIGRNVVLSLYSKILGPCPQGAYVNLNPAPVFSCGVLCCVSLFLLLPVCRKTSI